MVFASTQAVFLFFQAQAVIKFVLRAGSISEIQMVSNEHFINFTLGGISFTVQSGLFEATTILHYEVHASV